MSNLNAKAREAAGHYLNRRGYTVLKTGWACPAGDADIVAKDGDALVFVDVSVRDGAKRGFPSEPCGAEVRACREMVALEYLAEHDEGLDCPVRFDNIAMAVLDPGRAMIRHHINALGEFVAQPQFEAAPNGADPQALPEAA